eukprot:CAMPEP_0176434040 /NCGR_PEP_ID=MMETSP0127-20121128/16423_1 /TAXON_ID=938130 /ORGANISM="Platyophrya macrostoma, Strain WH" /LENGTH=472 /DNA_ID=CAMNT_0017816667 /DNA_START=104 /DNA_END=1519 /DNA_ORIENTATION=-
MHKDLLRQIGDKFMPAFVKHYKPVYTNKVFKKLNVEVSNITFLSLSLPSDSVSGRFEGRDVIFWSDDVNMEMSAVITFDLLITKKVIHTKISCKNSSMFQRMSISSQNGYPLTTLEDVSFKIGSFDLEFDGYILPYMGAAITRIFNLELLKPIVNFMAEMSKGMMISITNDVFLKHMMDNFDEVLDMPYKAELELERDPQIQDDFVSFQFNGTVCSVGQECEYPPIDSSVDMPLYDTQAQGKFQIFVSEYLMNSAIYAAWADGKFKSTISTKSLDNVEGLKIDLAWLKEYLKPVIGLIGNQTDLVIELDCHNPPELYLSNDTIETAANVTVTVSVMMNNTKFQVFTAETPYDIETKFYSTNLTLNLLNPNIRQGNFSLDSLKIIPANVGSVEDIFKIQELVDKMMDKVLKHMNITSAISAMPRILNLDMTTVEISVHDGYMQINANPDFVKFGDTIEAWTLKHDAKEEIDQP